MLVSVGLVGDMGSWWDGNVEDVEENMLVPKSRGLGS